MAPVSTGLKQRKKLAGCHIKSRPHESQKNHSGPTRPPQPSQLSHRKKSRTVKVHLPPVKGPLRYSQALIPRSGACTVPRLFILSKASSFAIDKRMEIYSQLNQLRFSTFQEGLFKILNFLPYQYLLEPLLGGR